MSLERLFILDDRIAETLPCSLNNPGDVMGLREWYDIKKRERNFVGQFLRKCRRFYLGTFRKDYIVQAIAETRQGDCHRCGQCCALIYKCPFLGKDSQNLPYCRIYGDLRPYNCRNYPFDAADAEIDACGFKFKEPGRE